MNVEVVPSLVRKNTQLRELGETICITKGLSCAQFVGDGSTFRNRVVGGLHGLQG